MGKKEGEYVVEKLCGVKEERGKLMFLVKWQGYSKKDNTWEPLENLETIQGMVNEYLLEHGYKPLTETNKLERVEECEPDPVSDADETENAGKASNQTKKKVTKKPGSKTEVKKEKKTTPQTLKLPISIRAPEVKKQLLFNSSSPAQGIQKPDPVRKTEKPQNSISQVSSTTSKNLLMKELVKAQPSHPLTQSLPAKRKAEDTSEPSPSKSHKETTQTQTSLPSGKKAILLTEDTKPEPSSVSPADPKRPDDTVSTFSLGPSHPISDVIPTSRAKDSNGAIKNLFQGFSVRAGSLEYDRPVKILGCREGKNGLEYSVMFAPDTKPIPLFKIVSHQELIAKAPWLFARFFIDNHSLPQ